MTSKRALFMLMVNQKKLRDGWKLTDLNTLERVSIEDCYEIVMEDLDRLEKLEKENQELKQKVNHFEKIIEDIKNMPDCDLKKTLIDIGFKHMIDNCKLKPLTEEKGDTNE